MTKKIVTALALGTFLAGAGALGVAPAFAADTAPKSGTEAPKTTTKKHHKHHKAKSAPKPSEGSTPSK